MLTFSVARGEEPYDGIHRPSAFVEVQESDICPGIYDTRKPATLHLTGTIGHGTDSLLNSDLIWLMNKGFTELDIYINSPGGSAQSGFGMIDVFHRFRDVFKMRITVLGSCQSMCLAIVASFNDRGCGPNSTFYAHDVQVGGPSVSGYEHEVRQTYIQSLREKYLEILSRSSNLTAEEWGDICKRTEYFDAETAVERGFITEVR